MASKEEEARRLLEEGNRCQREDDVDGAIEKYRQSIEAFPTADAHTYLGWMLSFKGEVEEAIRHCELAIEIDPEFGNPYNDIGAYLIQLGRLDEAEPWLRKAMLARRYEPRQFPHVNLGRIHVAKGRYSEAMVELKKALEIAPEDPSATHLLRQLVSRLNGRLRSL